MSAGMMNGLFLRDRSMAEFCRGAEMEMRSGGMCVEDNEDVKAPGGLRQSHKHSYDCSRKGVRRKEQSATKMPWDDGHTSPTTMGRASTSAPWIPNNAGD